MLKIRLNVLTWIIILLAQTLNSQWINMNSPWDISTFVGSGSNLYAGRFSGEGGALLSTDNGSNWHTINSGMPTPSYVYAFALRGDSLFAGTFNNGVFLTTNNGSSWKAVNQGLVTPKVRALALGGSNLFAGTVGGGVFRSTDGGSSWAQVNAGLTDTIVLSLLAEGTNLFAGTQLHGVFRSTNYGTTWTAANNGLPTSPVLALTIKDTNLFAGTTAEGAFISTNHGSSWKSIPIVSGLYDVKGFAVQNTFLCAFVGGLGIYLTTNNGTSWSDFNTGLGMFSINAGFVTGTYLYVGTDMGVWRRSISEMTTPVLQLSISKISFGNVNVQQFKDTAITITNNGGDTLKVTNIVSTKSYFSIHPTVLTIPPGENKTDTIRFLPDSIGVKSGLILLISNNATSPDTIEVSGNVTTTGITPFENRTPTYFSLCQNYPNPFNPVTTISFSLPSSSFISLKVFDVLGKVIATLISEELSVGYHSKQWDAEVLPSGIYFYRLQVGSYIDTKKLVLLK